MLLVTHLQHFHHLRQYTVLNMNQASHPVAYLCLTLGPAVHRSMLPSRCIQTYEHGSREIGQATVCEAQAAQLECSNSASVSNISASSQSNSSVRRQRVRNHV